MTYEQFGSFYSPYIYGTGPAICYHTVKMALEEHGVYSDLTMIGALATVRVEVEKNFKPIMEKASGEAYEGRKTLGNTQPGDGPRFKGRGYIQITGRANYTNYGAKLGLDLVNKPELALDPINSARILAIYFKDRKVNVACDKQDWVKVRKLVNGGTNRLSTFQSVVAQYKKKAGIL